MLSHDELVDEIKNLEEEVEQLKQEAHEDETVINEFTLKLEREFNDNNGLRVTVGKYLQLKREIEKIREIVKRHDGSDSHARKLFDEIEEKYFSTSEDKQ